MILITFYFFIPLTGSHGVSSHKTCSLFPPLSPNEGGPHRARYSRARRRGSRPSSLRALRKHTRYEHRRFDVRRGRVLNETSGRRLGFFVHPRQPRTAHQRRVPASNPPRGSAARFLSPASGERRSPSASGRGVPFGRLPDMPRGLERPSRGRGDTRVRVPRRLPPPSLRPAMVRPPRRCHVRSVQC